MNILDRYIAATALGLIAAALLLVLGVDFLFAYVHELGGIGRGDYHASTAFVYTALTIPGRLYTLFPMASLIGVLMALGLLASRSELIVMRASGFSILQIAASIAKVGLVLAVVVTLLGEFVVPKAEIAADSLKVRAKSAGQAVLTARGTWIREGNDFIHIEKLLPRGVLQGVTRYQFNDQYQLEASTYVEQATYKHGSWRLQNIRVSQISNTKIDTQRIPEQTWDKLINPGLLDILLSEPDDLSLVGLDRYIRYLTMNHVDANHYKLIFWKKILMPVSVIIMVLLGIPFVFGPLRQSSLGLRLLAGIVLGFVFYIASEIFGPLSLVYSFPPFLAAAAPLVLFAGAGYWMMRKVR